MKRVFAAAVVGLCVCLICVGSADARSKGSSSKALKSIKTSKAVPVEEMSPAQLKEARSEIEKHQKDSRDRHDKLLKQLYTIRAVAIKERAHETVEELDKLIEAQKKAYEDKGLKAVRE
ncbi:MAG: hypothetical protein A2Y07_03430 [Planctomycetes bacterium GWF2_50_10]|nr:MAG: hypothetical protein A2Y07_03430 [Planctomycetes bacterium GWF2_50_10]